MIFRFKWNRLFKISDEYNEKKKISSKFKLLKSDLNQNSIRIFKFSWILSILIDDLSINSAA